ncbi:MAG: helix-turn-helix domain-containing protein [Chloroflexi bacterium]|nr:helix-turn-helix domain-containing protein [Chloroflexota bacterium]
MGRFSEWVSLGEAAQIIGVHPATIRNWAEQGELPFRRTPGGHRRFRRSDLQQWLAAHRVIQPGDAQVIVQSALGRARFEIGDRQHLASQEWYDRLNPATRETMRQQGLRLMDTLVDYLANPGHEAGLKPAYEIGLTYGKLLHQQGLTLSHALQGYFYFVDFLLDSVLQLSTTNTQRPTINWGDLLHQINSFTRQTLLGMVTIYEQSGERPT